MKKTYTLIATIIAIAVSTSGVFAQEKSPLSFRLHIQPQVSSLNPYDQGLISTESKIAPSFAYGLEITRILTKKLELSLGYHYSSQAGNYKLAYCDPIPSNSFFPTGDRIIGSPNCPMPRARVSFLKVPIALGWRIVQHEKFMSRISFGPQIQILLSNSQYWLYPYEKVSAGLMTEWSNYFKLSRSFALVAGLRIDRSLTAIDFNSYDRSNSNSLGLIMGVEYTLWTNLK